METYIQGCSKSLGLHKVPIHKLAVLQRKSSDLYFLEIYLIRVLRPQGLGFRRAEATQIYNYI